MLLVVGQESVPLNLDKTDGDATWVFKLFIRHREKDNEFNAAVRNEFVDEGAEQLLLSKLRAGFRYSGLRYLYPY
ncbi:unnamed protein product [Prunus armeniaca]|uniref:Uncharacterized protein n=1 Tax=Prunus armeniaca TaxID=36596 RepID=A0A6J5VAH4_PRUAR|nr:unnamed protein product [Prunus armeniaca]